MRKTTKRSISILFVLLLLAVSAFSQKLNEPEYFGELKYGEELLFTVDRYDFETGRDASRNNRNKDFAGNLDRFVEALKKDPQAQGFIAHNSRNASMTRNIAKVTARLDQEGIDRRRVKTVVRILMNIDRLERPYYVKDDKEIYPILETVSIGK